MVVRGAVPVVRPCVPRLGARGRPPRRQRRVVVARLRAAARHVEDAHVEGLCSSAWQDAPPLPTNQERGPLGSTAGVRLPNDKRRQRKHKHRAAARDPDVLGFGLAFHLMRTSTPRPSSSARSAACSARPNAGSDSPTPSDAAAAAAPSPLLGAPRVCWRSSSGDRGSRTATSTSMSLIGLRHAATNALRHHAPNSQRQRYHIARSCDDSRRLEAGAKRRVRLAASRVVRDAEGGRGWCAHGWAWRARRGASGGGVAPPRGLLGRGGAGPQQPRCPVRGEQVAHVGAAWVQAAVQLGLRAAARVQAGVQLGLRAAARQRARN